MGAPPFGQLLYDVWRAADPRRLTTTVRLDSGRARFSLFQKRRSHQQGGGQRTDLQEQEAEAEQGRNVQFSGQEGGLCQRSVVSR